MGFHHKRKILAGFIDIVRLKIFPEDLMLCRVISSSETLLLITIVA